MATPSKTPPGADPKQLERTGTVREIGSQAVWSLSSCKPGFGVDQLRDDNLETYWQSDGSQPHLVNIQFRRRTTVKMLCIYADYKSDESYTPSKISVRVGNNFHNLQEVRVSPPRPGKVRVSASALTLLVSLVWVSAAAGDGGAQRMDPHLTHEPGQGIPGTVPSRSRTSRFNLSVNVFFKSSFCFPADERAHQHLHDPDRGSGQPPERQGHAHAADQGLHAGGGELHREVPALHHRGLHDVPHHQVIGTRRRISFNGTFTPGRFFMFKEE
uniref:Anaphase-promoting complex subunit 10 n=1 Tax=Salarias fasciatus TaxID=181472 RepID=A0A672HA98_SALFA